MKVVSRLDNSELELDRILSVYTGLADDLTDGSACDPETFETTVPERILPRELVLHELNLLQTGFTFWAKIDIASVGEQWVPVRIDA